MSADFNLVQLTSGRLTEKGNASTFTAKGAQYYILKRLVNSFWGEGKPITFPAWGIVTTKERTFSDNTTDNRDEITALFATKAEAIEAWNSDKLLVAEADKDYSTALKELGLSVADLQAAIA